MLPRIAIALFICLCARVSAAPPGWPQAGPAAAVPPSRVDPAVVQAALDAASEAARNALVAAHPEIAQDAPLRTIAAAAAQAAVAGRMASAVNAHRTLMAAVATIADASARRGALLQLGQLAGRAGDYAAAEPALREARDLAMAAGDADVFLTAINNLGIVARLQGRYDEALANYQLALREAEKAGRRDTVARVLNNLGVVAEFQGDLRAALDYHQRSLAIKEALALAQDMPSSLSDIGNVHYRQRNTARAVEYWERALAAAEQLKNTPSTLVALSNIGHVHAIEGRYDKAREALGALLQRAEAGGNSALASAALYNLGYVAQQQRQYMEAEATYQRCLRIREATGDTPGIVEALAGLADMALNGGDPERALVLARRGVALARPIDLLHELWTSLGIVGEAEAALGRTDAAIAAFDEAIAVIERMRRQVAGGAPDLQRYFSDKMAPYYELAAVHASAGRSGEALAAVERARARVLLDLLDEGRPIVASLSAGERAREQQLDRELAQLNDRRATAARAPAGEPRDAQVADIERALGEARRAKEQWQFETYGTHPDLRFGRGEAPIAPLGDVAAALPPGTTAVIYLAGEKTTRLLWLSRQDGPRQPSLRMATLPISRDELGRQVGAFARRIGQRDLGFAPQAAALYDLLLAPLAADLRRSRRLIVVPDGPLWQLPFQALRTPRGTFLIEDVALSYAHSLSALLRLTARRDGRAGRPERLVAIGNSQPGAAARLPETTREASALASMYGASSRIFIGADATESRFREAADATVLHVATHGELAASSPMYSFVALRSAGNADTPDRDGRLEAWEIANMTLAADLVVLSACETALGSASAGEGIVGLSWALLAAGAATTVVSQWRVDSASTTDLMLAFHRARRSAGAGGSPAAAMRQAARAMLASGRYRHPFYWAGFVVIGAP